MDSQKSEKEYFDQLLVACRGNASVGLCFINNITGNNEPGQFLSPSLHTSLGPSTFLAPTPLCQGHSPSMHSVIARFFPFDPPEKITPNRRCQEYDRTMRVIRSNSNPHHSPANRQVQQLQHLHTNFQNPEACFCMWNAHTRLYGQSPPAIWGLTHAADPHLTHGADPNTSHMGLPQHLTIFKHALREI